MNEKLKFEYAVYNMEDGDELKKLNMKINSDNTYIAETNIYFTVTGTCKMVVKFRIDDPKDLSSNIIGALPHAAGRS